jgi:hypothetical protein
MKLRNTLILLVLAAGLFAYLKFYDSKLLTTEEREARKGQLVEAELLDRDQVSAIAIRNNEGTLEFGKVDGVWRLTAPVKDRAERSELDALFTSMEGLKGPEVKNLKDNKAAQKEFGVAKGEISIKVTGKKTVEILLGKDTALEGQVYARVEGSDIIHTVQKNLRDQAAKPLRDWRDRNLSELTLGEIPKFTLKTVKGEMEIQKSGAHWSFIRPFKARADDHKVSDLIANATNVRIEEFLDAKDPGASGLNEPRATLSFFPVGAAQPVIVKIGAAKPEAKEEKKDEKKNEPASETPPPPQFVYASISSREGVFTVPASLESLTKTEPNDLRDQNIMRIQEASVNRITIEAPGKEKVVLEKTLAANQTSEEWVRKLDGKTSQPVNGGAANKLLSELASRKVSRFVADMASDLKGFGLDQPQMTVTVGDFSSEGTPETNPGEREQAKLLIGRIEQDSAYAKLSDEPFIFAVPKSFVDDIWTDPLQWQPLTINSVKREDIVALDITRFNQPTLGLVKDKDKGWHLAKGDGVVNQNAAQSLVNTLADLRAVRWIGATNPAAHGLEKPNLIITYTLADKKTGTVKIGSNTPDAMWHAAAEGGSGTFLINAPDFDALNGALVETPKPSAEASAPAAPGAKPVTPPPPATPPPVSVPPATESPKPAEPSKPTEAPATGAKPAPDSAPKQP